MINFDFRTIRKKTFPDIPKDHVLIGFEPNWELVNIKENPEKLTEGFAKQAEKLRAKAKNKGK